MRPFLVCRGRIQPRAAPGRAPVGVHLPEPLPELPRLSEVERHQLAGSTHRHDAYSRLSSTGPAQGRTPSAGSVSRRRSTGTMHITAAGTWTPSTATRSSIRPAARTAVRSLCARLRRGRPARNEPRPQCRELLLGHADCHGRSPDSFPFFGQGNGAMRCGVTARFRQRDRRSCLRGA